MKEQVIRLEPHDDITSVREKLGWVQASHVLIVYPHNPPEELLQRRLDLVLLQREATRKRTHLALITHDPIIHESARELGIPYFASVAASHKQTWKTAKAELAIRREDQPLRLNPALADAASRLRNSPQPLFPPLSVQTKRRLGIIALIITLLGLILLGPSATVRVEPAANQVTLTTVVVASPDSSAPDVDLSTSSIRARMVGVEVEGLTTIDTTGTTAQPSEKARGVALFTNLVPDQATIPLGTVVRTSAGQPVRFVTLADATLPGTVGATVEVPIEAISPGFEGNLPTARVNQVEGPLASRAAVTNSQPTQGGDVTMVPSVSTDDYARIRALLLQQLQQRAYAEIQTDPLIMLTDTEVVPVETLDVVLVRSETYNAYIGQPATQLSLDMAVTVQGVAIDERLARQVVYAKLAEKVGTGYEIRPDSLVFRRGEVTNIDDNRRVTFVMQGAGDISATITEAHVRSIVRGTTIAQAVSKLENELPLGGPPSVQIWPSFWPLISPLSQRINVEIGKQP